MIFHGELIKLYKSDGETLSGYGVEWTEARQFREKLLMALAVAFLMLGCLMAFATVSAIDVPDRSVWKVFAPAAVGSFGAFWLLRRTSARLRGRERCIEFSRDGRIWSSVDGLWKLQVADIRSIEAEQVKQNKSENETRYTHGVRMMTRRGRVLHVAKDLEPDDSITLAVLLSEALEATRTVNELRTESTFNGAEVW
jgi:hypothetical protein